MNKKMRELMTKIEKKLNEAQDFNEKGELENYEKAMSEYKQLEAEYEAEKKLFEARKKFDDENKGIVDPAQDEGEQEESPTETFAKFFKSVVLHKTASVPTESVAEDGGYTVPEDIQTSINHYKEAEFSFLDAISVENVTTNKGARTYQKKGEADVLVDLDETGAITNQLGAPKFERITYAIKDRAGFMPVSNDLVNDSTANIIDVVTKWIGKSIIATANAKVLEIVKAKTQTNLKDIKGIKKAVNVTLGQAYRGGVVIYTNDDGLNYLDTLEDNNGRPLLNPDPTAPTQLQLRCGATVIPVKVVPNSVLATAGTKLPFIIGDLKEGIKKFDRQSVSIDASGVASIGDFNAFEKNMTLMRCIVRDDYTVLDADAFVWGYIDTASSAAG